ncbi:MAG: hypothetical protein HRT44_00810, partial [Bdellovibrionales bacterium]|nr:hypothetical protein [Bdellovibrionales bacterium]NQZ17790.1 hypothetical protein [Bdellovibrionales bacterium]
MYLRLLPKILVILIATISFHNSSVAAEKSETQTKTKITKGKKKIKKKKLGVDQSDFMPAANNYGFIVSYGISYNQLEQTDVKTVNHRLSL